jgi:hypothetical protein
MFDFLIAPVRRGLLLLLLLLGAGLLASALVLGYRRHQAGRVLMRLDTVQARAARVRAAEVATRRGPDSAAAFAAGRRAELARTLTLLRHRDDSLTRHRPAPVQLPAYPPRE